MTLPLCVTHREDVSDAPYLWLTGFSQRELERLSYLEPSELEARIGLAEVPGGFCGERAYRGRAAHAIASYLGTRRRGPNVTLAFGYLREYLPALLRQGEADPVDIAANFAGVEYALKEIREGSESR
jgi:hypothetical protein